MSLQPDVLSRAARITGILLPWYHKHQRVFPFRGTRDPYRVWLSEVMLQQTRTATVGAYYQRFLAQFPDVFALADASEEQVLKAWEGLGYYTRARNLHKTAKLVAQTLGGVFPQTAAELGTLPGIGPYAAAAIASIAFDEAVPAMDGNLQRVISRLFLITEDIGQPKVRQYLQHLGQALMPTTGAGDMNQALMDLGATLCPAGTPDCDPCPLLGECLAYSEADPSLLPVTKQKKPPTVVPVAVCLLTNAGKVLVQKRREALLHGMYVFFLKEGENTPEAAQVVVDKLFPGSGPGTYLGDVKHIFTHRIWQMKLYHFAVQQQSNIQGGEWVDLQQLLSLPMPVANQQARREAVKLLTQAGTTQA